MLTVVRAVTAARAIRADAVRVNPRMGMGMTTIRGRKTSLRKEKTLGCSFVKNSRGALLMNASWLIHFERFYQSRSLSKKSN